MTQSYPNAPPRFNKLMRTNLRVDKQARNDQSNVPQETSRLFRIRYPSPPTISTQRQNATPQYLQYMPPTQRPATATGGSRPAPQFPPGLGYMPDVIERPKTPFQAHLSKPRFLSIHPTISFPSAPYKPRPKFVLEPVQPSRSDLQPLTIGQRVDKARRAVMDPKFALLKQKFTNAPKIGSPLTPKAPVDAYVRPTLVRELCGRNRQIFSNYSRTYGPRDAKYVFRLFVSKCVLRLTFPLSYQQRVQDGLVQPEPRR